MCVQDADKVTEGMEDMSLPNHDDHDDDDVSEGSVKSMQPSHSAAENRDSKAADPVAASLISFPVGKIRLIGFDLVVYTR